MIDSNDPSQWPAVLTPSDVAQIMRVSPKTVSRWANSGLLPSYRTPGGHHRFRREQVAQLVADGAPE